MYPAFLDTAHIEKTRLSAPVLAVPFSFNSGTAFSAAGTRFFSNYVRSFLCEQSRKRSHICVCAPGKSESEALRERGFVRS
jgi:hypothetical protein